MKKRIFMVVALLSTLQFAMAGAKEGVFFQLWKNPSILTEPIFWGIVAFIGVCVLIYLFIKNKDDK